jgi:tRNA-modifying protein YgfZ
MSILSEQLSRAREEGGAFLLPSRLLIRLQGADAFRYLNGQITRDLARLRQSGGENEAIAACILTPKGRLCAPIHVWCEGDDMIVESEPELEEVLLARLERFIVADDVTLSSETAPSCIHLFGKDSETAPWRDLPGRHANRLGEMGRDLKRDGDSHPPPLDPRVVELLRIERCIPRWGAELSDETLPPEAGLDRTHIDYARGCYPGQEVISRLKSIGRVNRTLHTFRSEKGGPVTGGVIVSADGKECGSITSVAPLIDTDAMIGLCYVAREASQTLFALDPLTGIRSPLSIT